MNKGIWLTALSGVLYGSIGYFGIKLIESGLDIYDMLLWRFLTSCLIMLPFAPLFFPQNQRPRQIAKALLTPFVLGALCYGGGTALYFESSVRIGTGLAMVIFYIYPIFVVALSCILDRAPLRWITIVSLGLILLGCALIASGDRAQFNLLGLTLAFLSGIGYGVYLFASKRSGNTLSPALATFAVCLGASLGFIGYSLIAQGHVFVPANANQITLIALFGLFGTVLPVLLMLAGMKTISANKASIISVLEPVTTLAVGAVIMGESVSSLQFLGAMVILSSAILIQLEKDKAT